ncbi:MAG TPA: AmmeMemoRadiSam system protein B [Dissulfurispiraceae bacterium]|nr:AmmeMemoRadiSam system protein B [Dissulfurispiraceae bacterium]
MNRRPVVAGQFYSASQLGLKRQVQQYLDPTAARELAIGIVAPHAGFMYSGAVAGAVYSAITAPKTFVLLGPNHTGMGAPVALYEEGAWEIPTATFPVDGALAKLLLAECRLIQSDTAAHMREHSLEVQLPFLAETAKDAAIVPIAVMHASLEACKSVGEAIAAAIRQTPYEVTMVASTDMSHYVSDKTARRMDHLALEHIAALNPEGLYKTVHEQRISMCGVYPSTIMLFAARALGAQRVRQVRYATSGEVSGDFEQVVGYAGLIVL